MATTPLTYRQWLQVKANDTTPSNAWDNTSSNLLLNIAGNDGKLDANAVGQNKQFTGNDGNIYYTAGPEGNFKDPGKGLIDVNNALYGRYNNYLGNGDLISQFNQENQGYGNQNAFIGATGGTTQPNLANTYLSQVDDILGRAKNAYNTQLGNVNTQYDQQSNQYNSQEAQRKVDVANQRTQNQQNLLGDRNRITDASSQGLRGLLSVLGSQGAGGSSAALFNAPNAVTDVATQQRAGSNQNFAQNEQGIDTSWNAFANALKDERNKLNDWRTNTQSQLKADYDRQVGDVNNIKSDLSANRGDASSLGSQLLGIKAGIPNAIRMASNYSGTTPVYNPAQLSAYQVDPTAVQGGNMQVAGNASSTPWLDALLGRRDDKNKIFA